MALRVLEQGWPIAKAAEAAEVSGRACPKWVARYRAEGPAGRADRSSAPRRQPHRTDGPSGGGAPPSAAAADIFGGRQLSRPASELPGGSAAGATRAPDHQPSVPGGPLNGPTRSVVIQPP
jgi:hypothetical protein